MRWLMGSHPPRGNGEWRWPPQRPQQPVSGEGTTAALVQDTDKKLKKNIQANIRFPAMRVNILTSLGLAP